MTAQSAKTIKPVQTSTSKTDTIPHRTKGQRIEGAPVATPSLRACSFSRWNREAGPATSSIARSARRPRGRPRQSGGHRDLDKALDASSAREPAVSSSANSAKALSGSSSASRTLGEIPAKATSQAESQETANPGICPLPVFRDALAAPVAETARGAVLSETSDPPVPRLPNEQSRSTRSNEERLATEENGVALLHTAKVRPRANQVNPQSD